MARYLLTIGGAGADILEVGYGSLSLLADHVAVWDTLARNGLFLTANGASDDHSGEDWARQEGRFYTGTWAAGLTERNLLDALARGRAYVGYLGSFRGTIDMTLDSVVPMGAVSVGPQTSRDLRIDVTDLPDGGAVEVLRGVVDHAGTGDPNPNVAVVTRLGARDLSSSSDVAIDTGEDCFVRLQVIDRTGAVVAFGQPIWTLKAPPPDGVPTPAERPAERRPTVGQRFSSRVRRLARSARFARRTAVAMTGARNLEKPAGRPRLRRLIRVLPASRDCQV